MLRLKVEENVARITAPLAKLFPDVQQNFKEADGSGRGSPNSCRLPKTRLSKQKCVKSVFLRCVNTSNIFLQLVAQHCCNASCCLLLHVLPCTWPTRHATKLFVQVVK